MTSTLHLADASYLLLRGALAALSLVGAALGVRHLMRHGGVAGGRQLLVLAGAILLFLGALLSAYDAADNVLLRQTDTILSINWLWLALDLTVPVWFLLMLRASTERDAAFARMAAMAETDTLTRLLNRRGLLDRAAGALAQARRDARPAAVLAFDLDRFKSVNDGWGHAAGDRVLQGFANILLAAGRRGDIAARLGGEEFAMLLPGADAAAALEVAERIRLALPAQIHHPAGEGHRITVSIGVAEVGHGEAVPALEAALVAADAALYAAKRGGRDRVVLHGASTATVDAD